MSLIVDVPEDISVCILTLWVDIRTVAGLDSAVCVAVLRRKLLKLIQAPTMEFSWFSPSSSWTTEFLCWCVVRVIKVRNLDIEMVGEDAQLLTSRILAICGNRLLTCDLRGTLEEQSTQEHWLVRCATSVTVKAVAFHLYDMTVSASTLLILLHHERPLRSIACRSCRLLFDEPISLYAQCSNLLDLDLYNSDISDAILVSIIGFCPQLILLNIVNNVRITDASMDAVAQHLPLLKTFYARNTSITDVGLCVVARACNKLESVSLGAKRVYGIASLTDVGIVALARGCPLLHTVDFDYVNDITDDSLRALGVHCPQLGMFLGRRMRLATDDGLVALADGCPLLHRITAPTSWFITDRALQYLAEKCKNLTFLKYFLVPGGLTAESQNAFKPPVVVKYAPVHLK